MRHAYGFVTSSPFTTSTSQRADLTRNVEIEQSSAYRNDDSPRAPQTTRSGWYGSIISSSSTSRTRPYLTSTSILMPFVSMPPRTSEMPARNEPSASLA